ncbi:unnamed protein product [Mytilus edulis]|uniref:DDE-1 domain-containing protein n=1 Tax=Mytilus edulis TaxID=6550 RepID=A0A8S3RC48_MYTED|nr:unnamed protein product [Mytilus edulis]
MWRERPQLLILDGHSSHESLTLIQDGIRENKVIMSLPPHTTHYLQVHHWIVQYLAHSINNMIEPASEFLQENMLHKIDKWTFPSLFKTAWNEALSKENIKSGFRACGIYPFNLMSYRPRPISQVKHRKTKMKPLHLINHQTNLTPTVLPQHKCMGSATAIPTASGDETQVCRATANPTASGDEMVSIENEEQTSTMSEAGDFLQPEIEDPEALLQLILDDKDTFSRYRG